MPRDPAGPSAAALREVWFGRVWRVDATWVIEEGPDLVVLQSPLGAPGWYPVDGSNREVRIPDPVRSWPLAERRARRDAVRVYRPGARHSVWVFRHEDGSPYWYVNFETPNIRTELGWDLRDDKLDLIVHADGAMRWKDEDELEEAAARGLVDAAAVRAEADRVLADPPWPTGWETWRPTLTAPPELPAWRIASS